LFREAGFARPEVGANFALALRGEQKRLLGMTFTEFAPELVQEGLASQEEVDRVAADLITLADDETTLFGFPLVAQVWATRWRHTVRPTGREEGGESAPMVGMRPGIEPERGTAIPSSAGRAELSAAPACRGR